MCGGTVTIHKTAACLTPQTGILCVVFAYTGNQNNAKMHKEEDAAYAGTTSTDAKRPHSAVAAHPAGYGTRALPPGTGRGAEGMPVLPQAQRNDV